jgi:hypothetical protein
MWELQLLDLFHVYLPAVIFAIISAFSILNFSREKKKGYLIVGIGFVLLTIGWVALPTVISYISLHYLLNLLNSINTGFGLIYLSYAVFCLLPALLILTGFVLLYKEPRAKTPQAESTPP